MRFNRNVSPELQAVLLEQLEEYKKEMKMSRKELRELYEWVSKGKSPYENGNYYCHDNGCPMDFVSALRFDKELMEMREIYITEAEDIGFIPQDDSKKTFVTWPTSFETDEELPF